MQLTKLTPKDKPRTPFSQVRMKRSLSEAIHRLAKAEDTDVSSILQAALFAWTKMYRPSYGAALEEEEKQRIVALLTPEGAAPKKDGRKR